MLRKKSIIISAGGTKEYIDPIRYISNDSSGKMGITIADAAYNLGFDVTLVCTFYVAKPYKVIVAKSASEMLETLKNIFPSFDALIMAAAISDFKVKNYSVQKIKAFDNLTLELEKNPDILKEIAKLKKPEQIVVGFALETENLIKNAQNKLKQKKLDFIIANEASGIGADENKITIINKNAEVIYTSALMNKAQLANIILDKIIN